jgi:hypothetical protein
MPGWHWAGITAVVMPVRATALLIAATMATAAQQAQPTDHLASLLNGNDVIELKLEAPLRQLFETGSDDDSVSVPGTLTYSNGRTGSDVVLRDVAVSVRGHTSRRESECTFPKLKLKLKGSGSLKIGTHCGESADGQLTDKYGRLANEKSPLRETLAYRMLEAAGVPTLRARPARITYIDSAAAQPLTRNSLLLEDDDEAMKRVGGTAEVTMDAFGSVASRHAGGDAGLIVFGEALLGNFDWCLNFAPDDIYRCDAAKPLWNVVAFERGGGTGLMMKDLDLAGVVVGRHAWFDTVWNRAFVPSKSPISIEVLSQVQRARSLFPRETLDGLRRNFVDRRAAILAVIQAAPVDADGRALARQYADEFFKAIERDEEFYRPVVARTGVQVYMDAQRTKEACGTKDVMRPGTPVNELQRSGPMSQVVVLDALWRWATKTPCKSVQSGPVWIASDAIANDYPSARNR